MTMVVKMIELPLPLQISLLFMIVMLLTLLVRRLVGLIDSGASIHATPRKDFFTSYTSGDFGSFRLGNDGSAKAIGLGDVHSRLAMVLCCF